jgi:hypothetical protein
MSQVQSLGYGTTPPNITGTEASSPGVSPGVLQAILGNLSAGTAWQNTTQYDVNLTVYLSVSANTSLVVKDGVGPTATPNQITIITGSTQLGIIPLRVKVPTGQYRLLSLSGTQTSAIVGQYLEAA